MFLMLMLLYKDQFTRLSYHICDTCLIAIFGTRFQRQQGKEGQGEEMVDLGCRTPATYVIHSISEDKCSLPSGLLQGGNK